MLVQNGRPGGALAWRQSEGAFAVAIAISPKTLLPRTRRATSRLAALINAEPCHPPVGGTPSGSGTSNSSPTASPGFGGDPNKILPSPTGTIRHHIKHLPPHPDITTPSSQPAKSSASSTTTSVTSTAAFPATHHTRP